MTVNLLNTLKAVIGLLRGVFLFGLLLIFIGFLYFTEFIRHDFANISNVDLLDNSLWGITYQTLYMFGFYFVIISLLLLLPLMSRDTRNLMSKMNDLWIFISIIGIVVISYSVLVNAHLLLALNSKHSWFDYFILGSILSLIGYNVLIFSIGDFDILNKYSVIFQGLIILGIILELISFLTYCKLLLGLGIPKPAWEGLFFVGIVPLYFGGLPYSLTKAQQSITPHKTIPIVLVSCIIIGGLTYLAPTLAINKIILPMTIFKYNNYFDYLLFATILTLVSIVGITLHFHELMRPRSIVWYSIFILGLIQIFISLVLVISDTYFLDLGLTPFLEDFPYLNGYSLLGMRWDGFFINGFFTTSLALIIISLILFLEALELNRETNKGNESKE